MKDIRHLSLIKGSGRYVIRYSVGQETEVIDALAVMAADTSHDFDWFDAAILSYQMGRRLEMDLDQLVKGA